MKKSASRIEKERIWKALVEKSRHRSGSVEKFCQAEGVSPSAFGYWQHKLSRPGKFHLPPNKSTTGLSAFNRVEILEPQSSRLGPPSAKWVAEIVLHLHRGMTA